MGYIQQLPRIFSAALPPPTATSSSDSDARQDPTNLGAAALGAAMGAVGAAAAAGAAAVAASGVPLGNTIGGALSAVAAGSNGARPVAISKQKASILLCALETVQLLVSVLPVLHVMIVQCTVLPWLCSQNGQSAVAHAMTAMMANRMRICIAPAVLDLQRTE